MTVFVNIVKRMMKSKLQFLGILILPTVLVILVTLSAGENLKALKISIIDHDRTPFTQNLANSLEERGIMKETAIGEIRDHIINASLDYVLVIPAGYTAAMLQGNAPVLQAYYLKESVRTFSLQNYVETYVAASKAIARAAGGDEGKFNAGMDAFRKSDGMTYTTVAEVDRNRSYMTLGMLLLFMFMSSVFFTTLVLTDKENRTFYRSISAPLTLKNHMLQSILAFFAISVLQVTFIFIALKAISGLYMGASDLRMYLLFLLVSLVCVSFSIAISSFSKNVVHACFIGVFITLPMTFLGGCWWSNDMSPQLIRVIGQFTPVYWVMESVKGLLNEKSLLALSKEILLILIFAAVFFFFGTWRKEDVAK